MREIIVSFIFIILFTLSISCKKEESTQIRLQNTDPVHDFTEVKFGDIFSQKLDKGETTNYIEIEHATYFVEWEFFAWGTYWATSEDIVTISEEGKYTLQININEVKLVKD